MLIEVALVCLMIFAGDTALLQAVCAAICSCHKVLAVKQVDYAFTTETYCEFLEDIAGACGNERIYLFQDNAR